jgi:hypothetical protein
MHPEILRQLIEQRTRETQARASERHLSRMFQHSSKARRHGGSVTDYDLPAIPDYVDGSFIVHGTASDGAVPAARHAA